MEAPIQGKIWAFEPAFKRPGPGDGVAAQELFMLRGEILIAKGVHPSLYLQALHYLSGMLGRDLSFELDVTRFAVDTLIPQRYWESIVTVAIMLSHISHTGMMKYRLAMVDGPGVAPVKRVSSRYD